MFTKSSRKIVFYDFVKVVLLRRLFGIGQFIRVLMFDEGRLSYDGLVVTGTTPLLNSLVTHPSMRLIR